MTDTFMPIFQTYDHLWQLVDKDYDPSEDGDDSLLADFKNHALPADVASVPADAAYGPGKFRKPPFRRELKRGSMGQDVKAVQRAEAVAGLRQWGKFTNVYGPVTAKGVKGFQKTHRLGVDGVYGQRTHAAFIDARLYDAYGAHLFESLRVKTQSKEQEIRNRIRADAMYGVAMRNYIGYTQGPLRMTDQDPPPNVPNNTDCSAFVTWCYRWAGAPNPNGYRGWPPYGFTGTLIEASNGTWVTNPQVGDLILYGERGTTGRHTAIVINLSPLLVAGHGSWRGPVVTGAYYRSDIMGFRSYL